jgi:vanillate O-demethylase monooxygenase subunit
VHLLAPVGATQTRYFWAAARNVALEDENLSQMMRAGTEAAFQTEDEPMIAAVQERMAALGLQVGNEAYFKTDSAAVQARRIVARLLASEAAA